MDWLKVIIVSAMPISELRGGIPLALYLGFDPLTSYILALIGNILPIPFILLTLELVEKAINKTPLSRIYRKVVEKTEKRKEIVEKYGYLGLVLFVAIPLPITGAWTGALLAFLLGLNKVKSFLSITIGASLAGLIVLTSCLGIMRVWYGS